MRRYFDPRSLKNLGYTGQSTTGELSGTQAVDFHTTGHDFFPAGSPQRAWLDAYARGVDRFLSRAKAQGIKAYFFVDMIVLPTFVIDAFPNVTGGKGSGSKILWNDATQSLLAVLINETFARFPDCDGFIVRTGETYTYDTPYHVGNSPNNGTNALWTDFVTFLRHHVCEQHGKDLFMRAWDNWASRADTYTAITDPVPTHPQLYFSIKHSAGDFTRPAVWNPTLATGKHAQIVEVELQREYESKGALPNYVMQGVIEGFPEMSPAIGLRDIIHSPQVRGLWTWTRGGGWWGPYIHGQEWAVDLHAGVLADWWLANGSKSERDSFLAVCPSLFPGCGVAAGGCCEALRNITLAGAGAVFQGQWGGGLASGPGDWMRDDRIGGLERTSGHFRSLGQDAAKWNETVALRQRALGLFNGSLALFATAVAPALTDPVQADVLEASIRYGLHLYSVVEAAWRVMALGYRKQNNMTFDAAALQRAVAEYDSRWAGYQAFGLSEVYAASLYHDYYLCLGNDCDNAFVSDGKDPGIGATVDAFRGEGCYTFPGWKCTADMFCSDNPTGTMTDWSYSGFDDIDACHSRCLATEGCTCFIHSPGKDPAFPPCRLTVRPVVSMHATARGYNGYVLQNTTEGGPRTP